MSNIEISVYCASDRFNYGDLLFPLILERFINSKEPKVNIQFYAMQDSDLSSLGGLATRNLRKLIDDAHHKNNHYVIVAGGEVLGATWFKLYRYLLPQKFSLLCRISNKLISQRVLDTITKKWYGSELTAPFILSKEHFSGNAYIIYNTVGGSSLAGQGSYFIDYVRSILRDAFFVSVRDTKTLDILKDGGVNQAQLAPDSAVIMSKFYSKKQLMEKICKESADILKAFPQGYWCFQVSEDHSRNHLEGIAKQIERVYQKFNLGVVLLPIGRASGHEDQIPLGKISKLISTPHRLPGNIGVFDIMALIAHSKLYAGTSLHGVITSTSFAVPRIGLTQRVPKLAEHLKCWDIVEYQECVEFDSLSNGIENALKVPQNKLDTKRQEVIEKANDILTKMMEDIVKNTS